MQKKLNLQYKTNLIDSFLSSRYTFCTQVGRWRSLAFVAGEKLFGLISLCGCKLHIFLKCLSEDISRCVNYFKWLNKNRSIDLNIFNWKRIFL